MSKNQFSTEQRKAKIPDFSPYWHYQRFSRKTLAQRFLTPWRHTSKSELDQIYNGIIAYSAMTVRTEETFCKDKAYLDSIWPELSERIRKNAGLTDFMMEIGKNSRFFIPFIMNIPHAITLEAADFKGFDLAGNFRDIPPYDTMFLFCCNDPMFRWLRCRRELVMDDLLKAKTSFFAGAGLLRELRTKHFPLDESDLKVEAYDIDDSLKPYLKIVFPHRLEDYNINYNFLDIKKATSTLQNYADVTIAHGIMSYRKDNQELADRISSAMAATKPDGVFYFDLQRLDLKNGTLLFDKEVLDWRTEVAMKPELSLEKANRMIFDIAENINAKVEVIKECAIGIEYKMTHKK